MQTLKIKFRLAAGILMLMACLLAPATALADTNCQTSGSPVPSNNKTATPAELQQCLKNNKITRDLNKIVNFLSAGVGIVITGAIIVGGIQYILAGDNATALTSARKRIVNGLIALVTFLFMYAFLQWLIPGGAFS
jgi:hypothetical protein